MRILIALALICIFVSCKKSERSAADSQCTFNCNDLFLTPLFPFKYYIEEEMDTLICKVYKGDSNFSELVAEDTLTFPDTLHRFVYSTKDSGIIFKSISIGPHFSCEFMIPGTGQTYRVWNVVGTTKTVMAKCNSHAGYACNFPIKEFELSGGAYELWSAAGPTNSLESYYLAFKK